MIQMTILPSNYDSPRNSFLGLLALILMLSTHPLQRSLAHTKTLPILCDYYCIWQVGGSECRALLFFQHRPKKIEDYDFRSYQNY